MSKVHSSGTIVVCLPEYSAEKKVLFGKNSDRPSSEVHEVILVPACENEAGAKLKCTYTEIDNVAHSNAVVLSKPAWMWGAQMGANEHSLTIGYNAVHTKADTASEENGLLMEDLVRLGLERSKSAKEAVDVITNLLSTHALSDHTHPTPERQAPFSACFIMADRKELWVVQTAGKMWATKKLSGGVYIFSNQLTIETDADLMSDGITKQAVEKGFWKESDGPLNFAQAFNLDPVANATLDKVKTSLHQLTTESKMTAAQMIQVLRDSAMQIEEVGLSTVSSMVSALSPTSPTPSIHWLTATPLPDWSMFKPIIFCDGVSLGSATLSPTSNDENSTNQEDIKREHLLWEEHAKLLKMIDVEAKKAEFIRQHMHQLESLCCQDVEEMVGQWDDSNSAIITKASTIFEHMIDLELNFLK